MLVVALSPAGVAGFEPVRTKPDLTGFKSLGPTYWRPSFHLRNTGYEDNIFFSTASEEVSDYTATLEPRLEFLSLLRDRAVLKLREQVAWTTFADHEEQNFLSNNAVFRGDLFLQRWSFYSDVDHLTTRERPADEIDVRPRRINRRLAAGSRFEHHQRLAVDLQASRSDTEYRDDSPDPAFNFRERLNRTERAGRLTVAVRAGRRTDFVLEAERRHYEFDSEEALTGEARSREILAGLDWEPRDTVRVKLRAGNQRLTPEDDVNQNFDGLAGTANIQMRLLSRVVLTLEGDRDLYISAFGDSLFATQNRGALRLATLRTRKLGAEAGVELYRTRYSTEDSSSPPRADRGSRYYIGALCYLSEKLSGGLRLARFERDSSFDSEDRNLTTLTSTLSYFF